MKAKVEHHPQPDPDIGSDDTLIRTPQLTGTLPRVKLDGSTSRTLILLASLLATSILCGYGKVDAQAFVAIVSLVLGGVVHASGARQGSQASVDPPPED